MDMLSGKLRLAESAQTPLRPKVKAKPAGYRSPGRVVAKKPAARPAAPTRPDPAEVAAAYEQAARQVASSDAVSAQQQETSAAPDVEPVLRAALPWATTGSMGGRTVHGASGELLGMMDTPGLAETVVDAVNDWVARRARPLQEQADAEVDPLAALTRQVELAQSLSQDYSRAKPVRAAAARVERALAALAAAAQAAPGPGARRTYSDESRERLRESGRRTQELLRQRREQEAG
jgi:hypothetical protein